MENNNITEQDLVPYWARAEHLERIVPLKELWKYSRSCESKQSVWKRFLAKIKYLNTRKEKYRSTGIHNSSNESIHTALHIAEKKC